MIYLNNAATSFPKPEEVITTVTSYLSTIPTNPSRAGFESQMEDVTLSCRRKLAALFNAEDPSNIIFTSGSTESLNLAIYGLDLRGGHVVTTAIEHNSVLRPLKTLEREGEIELSVVDCDANGYVAPGDIGQGIGGNTRAIIVNHCSNVTGETLDLTGISEVAHSSGVTFVVDVSQSAGCIPINVKESGIDILAFTGHKSLYGMPGIGGLYMKDGMSLKPLKVGGTGVRSDLLYQPEEMPMYYEAGTQNLPGIISLNAGLDFILRTGVDKIKVAKQKHLERIIDEFEEMPEVHIYGRHDTDNRSPIFCFNIEGIPPADTGYMLENSFNIITRSGLHCAPLIHKALGSYPEGSVRASPSYFTTPEEIECFIDAVKQMCAAMVAL